MKSILNSTRKIFITFALLAAAGLQSQAQAAPGFSLGVVGVGGTGINSFDATVLTATVSAKTSLIAGAGVAAEIGPLSAELIYMIRELTVTTEVPGVAAVELSTYGRTLDLPVMFRFGMGGASIGAGAYYQIPAQSGGKSSLGLTGGVRFNVPGGLFGDARFNYSLNKVTTSLGDYTPIEGLVMVGFNFL